MSNNWLPALSMVNAFLQSTNKYMVDKKAGDENALSNFSGNIFASGVRIGMAENMRTYGDMRGYLVNGMIPYTDANANQFAVGSALSGMFSPYGGGFYYGSPFMAPPMYPPMGGGGSSIRIWC